MCFLLSHDILRSSCDFCVVVLRCISISSPCVLEIDPEFPVAPRPRLGPTHTLRSGCAGLCWHPRKHHHQLQHQCHPNTFVTVVIIIITLALVVFSITVAVIIINIAVAVISIITATVITITVANTVLIGGPMRAAWRVNRGDGDAADDGKGDDGDGMVRMKVTTMIIDVDARDDCDDGNELLYRAMMMCTR